MGSAAAHHEPHDPDHVEEVLDQRIDELDPTARRLRKALLQGDSPLSARRLVHIRDRDPKRGLHYLLHQVVEELDLVLVFALVRFHEPLP